MDPINEKIDKMILITLN